MKRTENKPMAASAGRRETNLPREKESDKLRQRE